MLFQSSWHLVFRCSTSLHDAPMQSVSHTKVMTRLSLHPNVQLSSLLAAQGPWMTARYVTESASGQGIQAHSSICWSLSAVAPGCKQVGHSHTSTIRNWKN